MANWYMRFIDIGSYDLLKNSKRKRAIITQGEDNNEKIIAYYFEKLSNSGRNYSVTEKECLVIVKSIKKFRHYVEGVKFRIITDHLL